MDCCHTCHLHSSTRSAVVPIYRLDALSAPLILSRPALAGIYAGSIRWWNDTAIQSTNTATLPQQPIRVVYQGELSAVTQMWLTALKKMMSGFPITPSSLPTWPLTSYAAYGSGTGLTGVSAAVLTVDGSIGYTPQSNSIAAGVDMASIINWAGQTVSASASTVTAAITEVSSGYTAVKRQTLQLDYTDGHGALSWPIPILTNLMIDLVNTRGTCHQRAAVVDFWTWYYTSSVPAGLLANRQYATIPAFLQSQLNPVSALQTTVMCRGSPAVSVVSATARTLSTSTGTQFISALLANAYLSVDAAVSWQTEVTDDELAMDQVINAETDIGFFIPGQATRPLAALMCRHTAPLALSAYVLTCPRSSLLSSNWLLTDAQRTSTRLAGSRCWTRTTFSSFLPTCSDLRGCRNNNTQ